MKKVFTWTDIARIGRSVFADVPQTRKDLQNWTTALMEICTSAQSIVRSLDYEIETFPDIEQGILKSLEDASAELLKALKLFRYYNWSKFMDWLYYAIFPPELAGGVRFIEPAEPEKVEESLEEEIYGENNE